MSKSDNRWLTTCDVARMCGVHRRTVCQWMNHGRLTGFFARVSVIAFMAREGIPLTDIDPPPEPPRAPLPTRQTRIEAAKAKYQAALAARELPAV